jgi:hypothetical protein
VTAFTGDGREIIVRSREPLASLRVRVTGDGTVRIPGVPPFVVATGSTEADLPLVPVAHLSGRRGVEEWLYRQRIAAARDVVIEIVR